MRSATTHTRIRTMFSVRITDHTTGTDHLVDDQRYTVSKLTGRSPSALCGTPVRPASLLFPHGPVCDDCAQAQAARRLIAAEHATAGGLR